jgi:hypothetical protein
MPLTSRRILLAVACALIALACSRTKGDEELGRTISAAAQGQESGSGGEGTVVDVPRLAPFDWDRFFVFAPYAPAEKVRQELGSAWPEAGRIEKRDDVVLMVFVNQGRVVRFVDLPRSGADFAGAARQGGYSHSDAVFRCTKGPQGPRRCVFATGG